MATTPSATPSQTTPETQLQKVGVYVQLGGAGGFIAGAILSLHHYAVGICFIAGAAAFYVGQKLHKG